MMFSVVLVIYLVLKCAWAFGSNQSEERGESETEQQSAQEISQLLLK